MYLRKVKELREKCKLDENYIATRLECKPKVYKSYETGEKEVPYEVIIKLANFYNVSLDYLFERDNQALVDCLKLVDYILSTLQTDCCFVNLVDMRLYLDVICSDYHMKVFDIKSLEKPVHNYIYCIDLRRYSARYGIDSFTGKSKGYLASYGLEYAAIKGWNVFEIVRMDELNPRSLQVCNFLTHESIKCMSLLNKQLSELVCKMNNRK